MTVEPDDSKRQAIIDSATKLFLAEGFRKVSMEKVASAAPVSKATLYNHFASKDALLAEVIAQLCSSLLQTMNQAVLEFDDVENTLQKIAHSFVDLIFSTEALGLYRLIIAESRDFPGLGQLVYESSGHAILAQLENYLHQLNQTNRFYIPDPIWAADAFFSLLKGDRHFQCLLGIKPPPSDEEKQQLVNQAVLFYVRGVLNAA